VFHDRIPDAARSMVLTVDSCRGVPQDLPATRADGMCWHPVDNDEVTRVVQLVEFLDESGVPIAAGVPLQVQGGVEHQDARSAVAERDQDIPEPRPSSSKQVSPKQKTPPRS
jgi:hypothetical protein